MSKLQPSPEVLCSIDARCLSLGTALGALLLAGCLEPNAGADDTTLVMLSSESGAEASAGSTSRGGIMTTTEDPGSTGEPAETSASSGDPDTGDTTTGDPPDGCGDGKVQPGEDCDYGPDNADDGACTSTCHKAKCGDKLVQKDVEKCDDGTNDGAYNGCLPDCSDLAGHCGDFTLQDPEECDVADPKSGCLTDTCTLAESCKQIKDLFGDEVKDGVYSIAPKGMPINVLCDMDADGGGYTFFKIANANDVELSAKEAEAKCATYGLKLLAPRSKEHLAASIMAAKSAMLEPAGGGMTKSSVDYLGVLGIYPKMAGKSCPGAPFNSGACPEWTANGGVFYINNEPLPEPYSSEPGTKSCLECSLQYVWSDFGTLDSYESIINNNKGGTSSLVMCDYGDKLPPI